MANNHENLVMATLDKVSSSTNWGGVFPSVQLKYLPRIGTDHTPLVIDTGAIPIPNVKHYRFEKFVLVLMALGSLFIKLGIPMSL